MEERTAAISLLRQQERSLSLLKQQQQQQQQGLLRQLQEQHDLQTQCVDRTKGNGSDLLFMGLYMRPTRSIGTLPALFST